MNRKSFLLLLSISFALGGISCNHILWFRSASQVLVSHCRKLNTQNMYSINIAKENIAAQIIQRKFLSLPKYCEELVGANRRKDIMKLDSIASKDSGLTLDVLGEQLRIYADEYDAINAISSKDDNNITSLMLALNATALLFLGLFLNEDAKSINE